jgi:hypothetical protein
MGMRWGNIGLTFGTKFIKIRGNEGKFFIILGMGCDYVFGGL